MYRSARFGTVSKRCVLCEALKNVHDDGHSNCATRRVCGDRAVSSRGVYPRAASLGLESTVLPSYSCHVEWGVRPIYVICRVSNVFQYINSDPCVLYCKGRVRNIVIYKIVCRADEECVSKCDRSTWIQVSE